MLIMLIGFVVLTHFYLFPYFIISYFILNLCKNAQCPFSHDSWEADCLRWMADIYKHWVRASPKLQLWWGAVVIVY